jgi:hypothetical protein
MVWYSEYLVDENGNVLFSTPELGELDGEFLDESLIRFFDDFGILPWNKGVSKVA